MTEQAKADDLTSDISKLILMSSGDPDNLDKFLKKKPEPVLFHGTNQDLKLTNFRPKHKDGIAVRYLGDGKRLVSILQWLDSMVNQMQVDHTCSKEPMIVTSVSMSDQGSVQLSANDQAFRYIHRGQWIVLDSANFVSVYDDYDFHYLYEEV